MLSSRQLHPTDSLAKDIEGWQTPNRSVSPIEPIKGNMSPKPRMKVSMETEGHENKEEPEDKECVVGATTAAGEAPDSADVDSEYFIKPVRRGIALAQEIHDQYLICKICLENFKDPKCLDCMHTFCEECIENHVASESSYKKYSDYRDFTCPLCRKRTQLPLGGVRKLPDNHLISGLMKSVTKCRPLTPIMSFVKCDICRSTISYFRRSTAVDGDRAAVTESASAPVAARCLDCCKVLCAECAAVHRSTAVTRSHSVYDPDVVSDVLKDPNALACREHCNETVQYYCVDCRRCVCLLCAFDSEAVEPHVNHELVDFESAADRQQSTLQELCDSAAHESARLESELAELTTCADHVDAVRRMIQSTAESFRRLIDADEKTLLDRLDATYNGGGAQFNGRAAAASLKECVGRLAAVRRLAETVASRRGVELLLLHDEVENRLKRERQLVLARHLQHQVVGGSTDASGRSGGLFGGQAPDFARKRVEFVPGIVNLGRLDWVEGATTTGCGSDGRSNGAGCCPTCHRRSAAYRDQSTTTAEDGMQAVTSRQDKAVNTRARGLLHSSGNGSHARNGGRSQSFSSSSDGIGIQLQEQEQQAAD